MIVAQLVRNWEPACLPEHQLCTVSNCVQNFVIKQENKEFVDHSVRRGAKCLLCLLFLRDKGSKENYNLKQFFFSDQSNYCWVQENSNDLQPLQINCFVHLPNNKASLNMSMRQILKSFHSDSWSKHISRSFEVTYAIFLSPQWNPAIIWVPETKGYNQIQNPERCVLKLVENPMSGIRMWECMTVLKNNLSWCWQKKRSEHKNIGVVKWTGFWMV